VLQLGCVALVKTRWLKHPFGENETTTWPVCANAQVSIARHHVRVMVAPSGKATLILDQPPARALEAMRTYLQREARRQRGNGSGGRGGNNHGGTGGGGDRDRLVPPFGRDLRETGLPEIWVCAVCKGVFISEHSLYDHRGGDDLYTGFDPIECECGRLFCSYRVRCDAMAPPRRPSRDHFFVCRAMDPARDTSASVRCAWRGQ
jgi:hypothetical protein